MSTEAMRDFEIIKITVFPDGRVDAVNAAKYVGLAEKTMAMMRCGTGKKRGPKFLKRGKIFYRISDLDNWLVHGDSIWEKKSE